MITPVRSTAGKRAGSIAKRDRTQFWTHCRSCLCKALSYKQISKLILTLIIPCDGSSNMQASDKQTKVASRLPPTHGSASTKVLPSSTKKTKYNRLQASSYNVFNLSMLSVVPHHACDYSIKLKTNNKRHPGREQAPSYTWISNIQ